MTKGKPKTKEEAACATDRSIRLNHFIARPVWDLFVDLVPRGEQSMVLEKLIDEWCRSNAEEILAARAARVRQATATTEG